MRTPKEICLAYSDANYSVRLNEKGVKAIQDEAYNQALEDAVDKIKSTVSADCGCSICLARSNSIDDILNLKKTNDHPTTL